MQLLGQNQNRARAIISMDAITSINAGGPCVIRSGSATGPVIGAVSGGAPMVILRVEDVGQLLFESIWATVGVDATYTVHGTDVVWRQDVGTI